jgi:hypothetical protein
MGMLDVRGFWKERAVNLAQFYHIELRIVMMCPHQNRSER